MAKGMKAQITSISETSGGDISLQGILKNCISESRLWLTSPNLRFISLLSLWSKKYPWNIRPVVNLFTCLEVFAYLTLHENPNFSRFPNGNEIEPEQRTTFSHW